MELIYTILGGAHIGTCLMLILFILLQKGTGDGLFTSSNSGNPFMSGIEIANLLGTLTKYLGAFFLINTLFLAALSVRIANKNKVITEEDKKIESSSVPVGSN
jgi:protein translocase SecG subunit